MQTQAPPSTSWPSGSPLTVELRGSRVAMTWADGTEKPVNAMWLRDNCPCSECRIDQTGEHRYFLGLVHHSPTPTDVGLVGDTLTIAWSDGHTSTYSPTDFARITHVAERAHPTYQPWSDDFAPERFDYAAVIGDQQTRGQALAQFIRDGMILLTDVPTESGECIRFLEQIGVPIRDTPFDRLHDVFFNAEGYNVAHTDEPLPLHNDFASYYWPPSGQLLHMLVNDVAGGEWVNADAFKIVAELQSTNPEAVEVLSRVDVAFREHSNTAESWTRAPLIRRDSKGDVIGVRFSNQLMQPIDPCDPDLEAFYEAYHALALMVSDPKNQIEFRGEAGMMQMVHAHRVLHARRGFDGTSGARHLQDTYFEFDDVRALHALTTGEAR